MSTRSPTLLSQTHEARARDRRGAWYRQPIVWLGAAVLAVSIAGCVWLIVVAERHADPPLPVDGLQILKMPLTRALPQRAASSP